MAPESSGTFSGMREPASDSLHLLLVEDNPGDVRLVREKLREFPGAEVEAVPCLAAAVTRLAAGGIDLVLLDLGLPDSQGLATLTAVTLAAPTVPVVALTGLDDDQLALGTIEAGAQDYLVKDTVTPAALRRSVRYARERQRAQDRERLAHEVLELLSASGGGSDAIRAILLAIKRSTGLEAAGIRLRDGDDFPYCETNGFPDRFVQQERHLCARDEAGTLVRDPNGNRVLECMCGNVLCGRTDPKLPFFTAGGSFWSNCTTDLLASTTETERQAHTRNRCNGAGYESVALIPLRSGSEIIGLLQLNDHRRHRFTPEMIRLFEGLGASIGIALERQRAAAALRTSEAQLSTALQMARAGHWEYDVGHDLFTFNDNFYRIFRTTAAEVGGYRMSAAEYARRFCHPDDAAVVGNESRASIETADPNYRRQIEHRILYAGGEVGYITVRFFIVKDSEGRTVKTYGVNQDITERKQAEARIVHLNRVLRALREVNQLIVREKDPARLIRETCRLLLKERGYSRAFIVLVDDAGKPLSHAEAGLGEVGFRPLAEHLREGALPPCCAAAGAPEGVHLIKAADRSAVCAGCPLAAPYAQRDSLCAQLRHGESTYGYLAVTLESPLGTDAEEQGLFAEMASDVAYALHGIAMEARERQAEAERRGAEARQRRSQKTEALGMLAGGIAHDFNNILQGIGGYAELVLAATPAGQPSAEFAREIQAGSARAAQLVRQILTFASAIEYERRPLQLSTVVAEALRLMRGAIPAGIDIRQDIRKDCAPILGDPTQIHQVIVNLCTNAWHAMRDQAVGTLEATLTPAHLEPADVAALQALTLSGAADRLAPGDYACLRVSDTGCGMTPATLEHLFDPYFTTRGAQGGTGLGLAVVYGIARAHDAAVTVESAPGKGSTFTLYFPALAKADAPGGSATAASAPPPRGTERVLFVDDEPVNARLAIRGLEALGYRVASFTSPAAALQAFREKPDQFDVVITDTNMPGMNGLDLARALLAVRPELPIVLCTGYSDKVDAETARAAGIRTFAMKPLSCGDMARLIREIRAGPAPTA